MSLLKSLDIAVHIMVEGIMILAIFGSGAAIPIMFFESWQKNIRKESWQKNTITKSSLFLLLYLIFFTIAVYCANNCQNWFGRAWIV